MGFAPRTLGYPLCLFFALVKAFGRTALSSRRLPAQTIRPLMNLNLRPLSHLVVISSLVALSACGGGGSTPVWPTTTPADPPVASVAITDDAQGTAPPTRVSATYSAKVSGVEPGFFAVGGTCTTPPTLGTTLDTTNAVVTVKLTGAKCEPGQSLTLSLDPSKVTFENATLGNPGIWSRAYNIALISQKITGSISGLTGAIVLQNNAGETLNATGDGHFAFPSAIEPGSAYAVTVATQPPGQTCTVNHASGVVGANPVDDIAVVCSTNAYPLSGTVSGLSGSLGLKEAGGETLTITADGAFSFAGSIAQGAAYEVTVTAQPASQTCTVSNGSGAMGGAPVTNIAVTCSTNSFTVGGVVSGLIGTLTLQNNGSNSLTTSSDGSFVFSSPVAQGGSYNVTVATQPAGQTCSVVNGTGTVAGANVTNVMLACSDNTTTISASPSSFVVPVNGPREALVVINTGSFAALDVTANLPSGWTGVAVDASNCVSVPPGGSCILYLSSVAPYVAADTVKIQGSNTQAVNATVAFSLAGLLVFDVSPGSAKVVSSTDYPEMSWGDSGVSTGAFSVVDGAANTQTIVNTMASPSAARTCAAKTTDGGPSWYLPAPCEMSPSAACATGTPNLFTNLAAYGLGGFPAGTLYWTSAEDPSGSSLNAVATSLGQYTAAGAKTIYLPVRCVASVAF